MADPKSVEMKPFLRQGEEVIAGIWNGQLNMYAKDYHGIREGVMKMRAADPATGALYDKYLTDVVKGKKDWPTEQLQKLKEGFQKQNLGFSNLSHDVALDLKAHGYNSSYRPPVMVSVNGRPMDPEVVMGELKRAGATIESDIPRSLAPGKVSHSGLVVKQESIIQALDKSSKSFRSVNDIELKLGRDSANVLAQVTEHAGGLSKYVSKVESLAETFSRASSKLGPLGKAGAAVALAGISAVSQAAETGQISTRKVGEDVMNGTYNGLGTVALGEGPMRGKLCKVFGDVAVPLAVGTATGLAVGAATSLVATPVGGSYAGYAAGAAATMVAEKTLSEPATNSCNNLFQKLGM